VAAVSTLLYGTLLIWHLTHALTHALTRALMQVPFDPVAWNATAPATIMYLIPNMLEVGGAELIDWHIVSHLLSSAVDPPMRVVLVVESLLRKRIEPSATSLHRWHARYERLLGAENLLYLDHVIDPELACAEHLRLQVLEHLVTSRAVQLLFNRNTYIGYSLAKRWRTLKLFPSVALADLIHLYEPLEGAWERYSAPYHSHLDARFVISNDLRDHMVRRHHLTHTLCQSIHQSISLTRSLDHQVQVADHRHRRATVPCRPQRCGL